MEILRRIRRNHESNKAEAAPATPVQKDSEVDEGRRNFLRGAGATLAMAAIPSLLKSEIAQAASMEGEEGIRRREAVIERYVFERQREMNSPDVQAALEGKGENTVHRMLGPLQIPFDSSYIKGTKYDSTKEREQYSLQFSYQRGPDGKKHISFRTQRAGSLPLAKVGYGNGFFFGRRDRCITAQHVVDDALDQPEQKTSLDISVVNVAQSAMANPENVIQDDTSLTNAEIHCAFVTVEGYDPDATSTNGCKTYAGVAMRLHRGFVERAFKSLEPFQRERLARSFVMALPPGEAVGPTPESKPAAGMSGSAVYMYRNGQRVLAGELHSVLDAIDPVTKQTFGIGFFHGIEEVREKYTEHARSGA